MQVSDVSSKELLPNHHIQDLNKTQSQHGDEPTESEQTAAFSRSQPQMNQPG